jgi:hypothetical protein
MLQGFSGLVRTMSSLSKRISSAFGISSSFILYTLLKYFHCSDSAAVISAIEQSSRGSSTLFTPLKNQLCAACLRHDFPVNVNTFSSCKFSGAAFTLP